MFVTGDLNVNFRRDRVRSRRSSPTASSARWGWRRVYQALSEPSIGTATLRSGNDTRLIDYVYLLPRKPPSPPASIVRGLASDHRPLAVDSSVKVSRQVDTTSPPDARRPTCGRGRPSHRDGGAPPSSAPK